METTSNAFALTQQQRQRKKRIRTLCIFIALAAVLAVAAIVLVPLLTKGEPGASVLTWQVGAVTEGEIRSTISGSGTLSAKRTASYAAPRGRDGAGGLPPNGRPGESGRYDFDPVLRHARRGACIA